MDDVEEQILSYPHLPDEQKRKVETYVEEHPEWAPLLRDVRNLESVARDGGEPFSGESLVVAYAVAQHLEVEVESDAMAEAFEAIERRMKENDGLHTQVEAARRRLREAEAKVDPVSQFEALTGHSLTEETSPSGVAEPNRSSTRREGAAVSSFIDRVMALPLAVRGVGAAVVVVLGTYAALFAASTASQSPLDRLAAVEVSEQMMESYYSSPTTRGLSRSSDTAQAGALYLDALSTLREARTSTLGLFPGYDSTAVQRAEAQLRRVLEQTEPDSFLGLEAQFYLGKAYLAQGRVDAARARFETVVENEGRRAEEARRILRDLGDISPESG
jgi:TolA-binding protein